MIGERLQGVKRKLPDQDADLQVRCIQRQTIFNISLCKLRKNAQSPEPILYRTVLIANTVRRIQKDIEEESTSVVNTVSNELDNGEGNEINEPTVLLPNHFHQHDTRSRETGEDLQGPGTFEKELNLLGDKITKSLEILSQEEPRLTTKQTVVASKCESSQQHSENGQYARGEDTDREINCGNLLGLELKEELEFSDVDVSLYDFDVQSFPVGLDEFCGAFSASNAGLASRCCESIILERKNDHAFDELDQVMQILVGS